MSVSTKQTVLLRYDHGSMRKSRHTLLCSFMISTRSPIHPNSRTTSKESSVDIGGISRNFLFPGGVEYL
jgi:hypothetical protein